MNSPDFTPEELAMVMKIIETMSEEECEEAIQRIIELAEMQNTINEEFQKNPMVFSSCGVLQ